ncbi:MAG: HAD-IIA family hydrolase [Rhodospirillaceae bacterium]
MTPTVFSGTAPLRACRGFLLDLDGTLIRGDRTTDGAAELLERLGGRFVLVSNNSSRTAATLSADLAGLGLEVPSHRIVLAGEAALEYVAAHYPGGRVLAVAAPPLRARARELGLVLVERSPDAVLLACDEGFDYAGLSSVVAAVNGGSRLVVANPDRTRPGADGAVHPETGALLAAILACTGGCDYELIGKPAPMLLCRALERLGLSPAETVLIGDNLETDGLGARRIGMPFCLLGPHPGAVAADPAGLLASEAFRSV